VLFIYDNFQDAIPPIIVLSNKCSWSIDLVDYDNKMIKITREFETAVRKFTSKEEPKLKVL